MYAYSWGPLRSLFRVISGRCFGMMTLSNRKDLITGPYGAIESLGLFVILRG